MRLALKSCALPRCFALDPAKQQRNPHNNRLCCHCNAAVNLQKGSTCIRRRDCPLANAGEHLSACWWAWQRGVLQKVAGAQALPGVVTVKAKLPQAH